MKNDSGDLNRFNGAEFCSLVKTLSMEIFEAKGRGCKSAGAIPWAFCSAESARIQLTPAFEYAAFGLRGAVHAELHIFKLKKASLGQAQFTCN